VTHFGAKDHNVAASIWPLASLPCYQFRPLRSLGGGLHRAFGCGARRYIGSDLQGFAVRGPPEQFACGSPSSARFVLLSASPAALLDPGLLVGLLLG